MESILIQLSKYVIIVLFAIYTLLGFRVFKNKNKARQEQLYKAQRLLTVLIHMICSLVLMLHFKTIEIVTLYLMEFAFYFVSIKLYQLFYKGLSKLVLNNMLMCMLIGFVIQGRLSYNMAVRQLLMASVGMGVCLFVPVIIQKLGNFLEKLGWVYCGLGVMFLLLVFVIGVSKYGARNWISVAGIELQPSEFVKIIYVFFIAAMLAKWKDFKHVCVISVAAGVHVVILVLERDLGGALLYFFTYLMVLFVATMKMFYLVAGVGGGSLASVVAYKLFSHVRIRIMAWRDPWSCIANEGYQITQSLFAIGTGGWLGMGLCQGLPENVPVVESDFVISAISEELGGLFAICLILVYVSNYIMFANIAMKMKNEFYKFTAFGLSVLFIFQVLLCIGGATKFIPSTGVTLPLISYGGSSILSTIVIFSIIQGMYVLNGKEEIRLEEEKQARNEKRREKKRNKKKEKTK